MSIEGENTNVTTPAVDTLMQLARDGRDLCPPGTDPDRWAGDVLYDLARIAELLDAAVEQVSGDSNDTVAHQSSSLASVITAHRSLTSGARDT